jgi:hypothetical protein
MMAIIDSTNRHYDDFRWSAYNTNGQRLFTVDFDNSTFLVAYALDNTNGFVSTGANFTNSTIYELGINMDFMRNSWEATLNNAPLISPQPITTIGAALNLGDIDAVWAIRTPGAPGNNYMVFDDYRIMAKPDLPMPAPAPRLAAIGHLSQRQFVLRLNGEPNRSYAIEASTNLIAWSALKTNITASDGTFDFLDTMAAASPRRFYRARQVGP